ncbi:MAG: hypothetical protein H7Y32_04490, partial [Chloroflexales bacterium]|nr:hypothetical protein [Chloroflexales bacterium]
LEEGAIRRVLAQALLAQGDIAAASAELRLSEEALHEAGNRYELARTQVQRADLFAHQGQRSSGAALLHHAFATLSELGAQHDLALARAIAARWEYTL